MTPSRFDCTVAAETNDAVQGLPQEKGQTDGMRDRLVLTSHCVLLFPVETRSTVTHPVCGNCYEWETPCVDVPRIFRPR